MTRDTGIGALWILLAWIAIFTFLSMAASGCFDVACFNDYRANLFHHAQE